MLHSIVLVPAIHQRESATGAHTSPALEPPSHTPMLPPWVVSEHQAELQCYSATSHELFPQGSLDVSMQLSPFILPSPPTVSTSLFLTSEPLFLPKFYYHHQELGLLNTLVRNFLLERKKIDILLYQKLAENLAHNLRESLGLWTPREMQINSHLMNIILYSIF